MRVSIVIFLSLLTYAVKAQQSPLEKIDSIFLKTQYYDDSKIDSLRISANELRAIGKKSGIKLGEFYALRFEGWAHEYEGNYDKALATYLELLQKAKEAEDSFSINMAYNDMGAVYIHTNQNQRAKAIYQEAIDNPLLGKNDPKRLSTFYNNLGIVYKRLDDLDSALICYSKSLGIKKELGDLRGIADLQINMASLMVSLERYDEAEKITLENLEYLKDKDSKADKWSNLNNLAGIRYSQGKEKEAIALLKECLILANELGSKEREMETSQDLAHIYEKTGEPALALSFYKAASEIRQELINFETNKKINELQEEFNAKEREVENKVLNAQLQTEKQRRWVLLSFLILACLIVAGVIFALQKNRKKNQQLAHQNELINQQKDKLTELNSEKNNLISIVSHDLRSPFNTIALWNKTLQDNLNISPLKVAEATEMVARTALYGQQMINNILDIEKSEINNHQVELTNTDSINLVRELIEDFQPASSGKEINIQLYVQGKYLAKDETIDNMEFFTLLTDANLLRRALENLISNALKFSKRNSEVFVYLAREESSFTFTVKDFGIGIPKEEQSKLFSKYGQTSASPTENEASTGLGLSIVKRIMEELGGTVSFLSESGKGSEFTLTLPV